MVLVSMKRQIIGNVGNSADLVMCGWPLPPRSTLVNVKGRISLALAVTTGQEIDTVWAYGITAYILPVLDMDAAATFDTIWDTIVPKDELQADDALDLDTGTADTSPEMEPGLPNLNSIMGIDVTDRERVCKRFVFVTYPSHPGGLHLSTTLKYVPSDAFQVNIRSQYFVSKPSVLLFGISSPVTNNTSATIETAPSKQEWGMLMFLEHTIENMMQLLFSFPEAGAESPYEEASAFIAKLVEPLLTETTGRSANLPLAAWDFNCLLTAQVNVRGPKSLSNLSGG